MILSSNALTPVSRMQLRARRVQQVRGQALRLLRERPGLRVPLPRRRSFGLRLCPGTRGALGLRILSAARSVEPAALDSHVGLEGLCRELLDGRVHKKLRFSAVPWVSRYVEKPAPGLGVALPAATAAPAAPAPVVSPCGAAASRSSGSADGGGASERPAHHAKQCARAQAES